MRLGLKGGRLIVIDQKTAEMLVQKTYSGFVILKQLDYQNWFVFLLAPSDQDEPPTFFRVDKKSGQVEDFQPWDLPDPQDFEKAFLA